ncbi:MAG: hypothetical protein AAFN65_03625 [Bacteroidota bacterium]
MKQKNDFWKEFDSALSQPPTHQTTDEGWNQVTAGLDQQTRPNKFPILIWLFLQFLGGMAILIIVGIPFSQDSRLFLHAQTHESSAEIASWETNSNSRDIDQTHGQEVRSESIVQDPVENLPKPKDEDVEAVLETSRFSTPDSTHLTKNRPFKAAPSIPNPPQIHLEWPTTYPDFNIQIAPIKASDGRNNYLDINAQINAESPIEEQLSLRYGRKLFNNFWLSLGVGSSRYFWDQSFFNDTEVQEIISSTPGDIIDFARSGRDVNVFLDLERPLFNRNSRWQLAPIVGIQASIWRQRAQEVTYFSVYNVTQIITDRIHTEDVGLKLDQFYLGGRASFKILPKWSLTADIRQAFITQNTQNTATLFMGLRYKW